MICFWLRIKSRTMKNEYRKYDRFINTELGKQLRVIQRLSNVRKGITMLNNEKKFGKFKRHRSYVEDRVCRRKRSGKLKHE